MQPFPLSAHRGKRRALTATADVVYAAIDGQQIGSRRARGRVKVFSIHHQDRRWWVQFQVSGRRPYMATVSLNDHQLANVLGAIELLHELQDPTAFDGTAVTTPTFVRSRVRARDVLALLKDRHPIPDRRTRPTRRSTRRGGRRRTDV
jgi:hypothetical protein